MKPTIIKSDPAIYGILSDKGRCWPNSSPWSSPRTLRKKIYNDLSVLSGLCGEKPSFSVCNVLRIPKLCPT